MKVIMVYVIAPTGKNNSHEVADTELGFSKDSMLLATISVILYMSHEDVYAALGIRKSS